MKKEKSNNLLEEKTFLENRLEELRKLPFIKFNPKNPTQQRTTPAGKQYKELLQQYINLIKALEKLSENENEISPLREWLNNHIKMED
jgi:hypothetical protein